MSLDQSSNALDPCRFARELSLALVASVQLLLGILIVVCVPDAAERAIALVLLFVVCAYECIVIWRESSAPDRIELQGKVCTACWRDGQTRTLALGPKSWLGDRLAMLDLVGARRRCRVLLLRSHNKDAWHQLACLWQAENSRETGKNIP